MRNSRFALFVRHVDLGYWRFTGSYRWLSQSFREGRRFLRNEGDRFFILDMETQMVVGDEDGVDWEIWRTIRDIENATDKTTQQ